MRRVLRTVGGALAALALGGASVAPAMALAGGSADRGFIVGRWTDDGDCSKAASFSRDGTFVVANGDDGLWHIADDRLTLTGSSTLTLRIIVLDRDSMDVINPDGSRGHSTRCPGGESGGGQIMVPSHAYVVGRWTDSADCSVAASFLADGRFVAHNGNAGRWTLRGDRLTLTDESTLTLQIVPIDQNRMNVVNPDGSLGRSTRC